ncbi:MAG TPA: short-chain dehydrogenase [Rhodospirillaceae bacterium]|nr:short-chain dehydrogenase [Rhodospirillaceae bacterium]HAA94022.1 short-chain dehydrogenase [Rhodospirillaceae bacterium]HAT35749.1 short-chain dehydrogenase [Rhodospirillaceae bacterium]
MGNGTEKTLAGKVALITGAVRRSGRASALELAKYGASIAINTRRSVDEAQAVKAELEALGVQAGVYLCDVTDEDGVTNMVGEIANDLGPIDILVNNAADRGRVPTLELDLDEFRRIVAIILEGAFLCSRAVLPHMIDQGWGRIVNISGIGNYVGYAERVHVHAGKGGLDAITRSLSSEFCEHGITVNTVGVGKIGGERAASAGPSPKNVPDAPPIGFEGEPGDIANAVAFLCQPASRFITGTMLHVNGNEYLS